MPQTKVKRWATTGALALAVVIASSALIDNTSVGNQNSTRSNSVGLTNSTKARSNDKALLDFAALQSITLGKASDDIFFSNLVVQPIDIAPVPTPQPTWSPPPPVEIVEVASQVVATPTAPVMPYTYIGYLQESGGRLAYFADSNEFYAVRQGDMLGTEYQVKDISEDEVTVNYLPLNTEQTIFTGTINESTSE